jgi:hypothetical protein
MMPQRQNLTLFVTQPWLALCKIKICKEVLRSTLLPASTLKEMRATPMIPKCSPR